MDFPQDGAQHERYKLKETKWTKQHNPLRPNLSGGLLLPGVNATSANSQNTNP